MNNQIATMSVRSFRSYAEVSPVKPESRTSSVAHLIDIERTVWDPDYRRWAIDQLSKQDHG
jgi:hypothetical protein